MNLSRSNLSNKCIIVYLMIVIILLSSATVAKDLPGNNQKIDLNLRAVDLKDAFRALADISGINIITDSSVEGKVTVNLHDLSFIEAVKLLTKTNGLSYRVIGNTVIISTAERLQSNFDKQATKIFELNNSTPKEIKESLNLLVEAESIRIDNRTSSLIVTAYQGQLTRIEKLIESLDKSKKQIILEARIEEISRGELEKLGIEWGFEDSGLNLAGDNVNGNSISIVDTNIDNASLSYNAVLNLLESNDKATLLANPKIATIDGKEAEIKIVSEIPIVTTTTTEEDGEETTETTVEERQEVGIKLKITPKITNNNKIAVEVAPEVSTITKYIEDIYPVVSTREAITSIRIKSGKTIAIGGLIKNEEIERLSKVPFLGDMPILGKLFQNRKTDISKRELVIFITPKIIDENGKTIEETKSDKSKTSNQKPKKKKSIEQTEDKNKSKQATAQNVFKIQVGSFEQKQKAEQVVAELEKNGFASEVIEEDSYQAQLQKEFTAKKEAEKIASQLEEKDFSTWIHRKDKKDE